MNLVGVTVVKGIQLSIVAELEVHAMIHNHILQTAGHAPIPIVARINPGVWCWHLASNLLRITGMPHEKLDSETLLLNRDKYLLYESFIPFVKPPSMP